MHGNHIYLFASGTSHVFFFFSENVKLYFEKSWVACFKTVGNVLHFLVG